MRRLEVSGKRFPAPPAYDPGFAAKVARTNPRWYSFEIFAPDDSIIASASAHEDHCSSEQWAEIADTFYKGFLARNPQKSLIGFRVYYKSMGHIKNDVFHDIIFETAGMEC